MGDAFEAVMVAARADAPWAYERLWGLLAPAVVGYLRLQGMPDPEDLTSEVFLGAFAGLARFEGGEAALRSFVFAIARRRVVDERRRAARRPVVSGREVAEGDVMVARSAEDEGLARLGEERVRRLCAGLGDDQRDVMLLRLVGGLTVVEVAGAVGKSVGAVKALQRRAVRALAKVVESQGVPL